MMLFPEVPEMMLDDEVPMCVGVDRLQHPLPNVGELISESHDSAGATNANIEPANRYTNIPLFILRLLPWILVHEAPASDDLRSANVDLRGGPRQRSITTPCWLDRGPTVDSARQVGRRKKDVLARWCEWAHGSCLGDDAEAVRPALQ